MPQLCRLSLALECLVLHFAWECARRSYGNRDAHLSALLQMSVTGPDTLALPGTILDHFPRKANLERRLSRHKSPREAIANVKGPQGHGPTASRMRHRPNHSLVSQQVRSDGLTEFYTRGTASGLWI